MKVYVSRHKELYDKNSIEKLGKAWPVGMSVIPAVLWISLIIVFIYAFLPAIFEPDLNLRWMPIVLWIFLLLLTTYLSYDVYGNYLYYKGIWKDPPFAKRSVKKFWKDLKKGKIRGMILWGDDRDAIDFHIIYQGLGNRGVVVKISKEEKLGLDSFLKERMEREAKRVRFEYDGIRVKDAIIEYENGKKELVGKKKAELMRFFYVISKDKLASGGLYASEIMKKLVEG